ncbi:hypothetical protein [Sinomicrobium sp.]
MSRPIQFNGFVLIGVVVLLQFLSCKSDTVPDIYIDQLLETVDDTGNNVVKRRYLDAVNICQEAGRKVAKLSAKSQNLLGTRRYRLSVNEKKIVERVESWGFGMTGHYENPDECRFELVYEGSLTVRTPGRTVVYDLKEGTVVDDEAGIPEAFRLFFQPVSLSKTQRDSLSNVTFEEGVLFDQPVLHWVHANGNRETIWSGGTNWGFLKEPSENINASTESIVLQAKRKGRFYTVRVSTQQFTIGKPMPDLEEGLSITADRKGKEIDKLEASKL